MKNKNLQRGFAPLLIIAIVAVLAVGGGAYFVAKNKSSDKKMEEKSVKDAQSDNEFKAEVEADGEIDLNVDARGSLRSLVGGGKNMVCTFTEVAGGANSTGTVYIFTDGSMRGDFTAKTSAGTQASSMIMMNGTSYVWSGSQGIKMMVDGEVPASSKTKADVDLDSQVNYKCSNWSGDRSKFIVPTSVKFIDMQAMMKGSGGIDLDVMMKTQKQ